ncbi:MAG: XdhC/CoxI family protein [Rhodobacteraceae bacterium]|nr:MAG: XdhC/CoxI family protein [Paracoccaceae bacterium]
MADFDQIPEQALDWIKAGKGTVLATVIQTWGSAPRPTGSQLAINEDMEMAGSVSGGCVEGAVVEEAINALEDGIPRILEYGVSDEEAFAVGLACGGAIHVLIEPIGVGQGPDVALLETLVKHRKNRHAVAYLVNPKTWERQVVEEDFNTINLAHRFTSDKSGFEGDWFVNIHNPPLRMIVVGAVHIAQPLMQMARLSGYDAVLIDPRGAFATAARFPNERLVHDWPDEALEAEGLDARVAVVTLTHDPKLDDPAIKIAIASDAFYLGCLGSTRTHAKRVTRLKEAGFSDAQIAKIHAPVGADIGSKTPAEIAISIMAEITERLRRPETRR